MAMAWPMPFSGCRAEGGLARLIPARTAKPANQPPVQRFTGRTEFKGTERTKEKCIMTIHAEVLPTYRRVRQVGVQLNHKLVASLNKEIIETAGKRLGIFKNGTLVFDSEDEVSVLMDYAIHNMRVDGQNAVERYLDKSPPPDSAEMAFLKTLLEAYYSIFQVVKSEPGVGVSVRDLLRRDDDTFIADVGFSFSAPKNNVLATRVIPLEEPRIFMTGGAALPVSSATLSRIMNSLNRTFGEATVYTRLTRDQESDLAAMMIRICLESGMSSYIDYGSDAEEPSRSKRSIDPREVRRANRNDPCPCGSGRKFKACCGRRPRL
jgi:hypothetical protein